MKNYKYLLSAFCSAWDMLIDIKIPYKKKIENYLDTDIELDNSIILLAFPIIGLVIGLLLFAMIKIASLFLTLQGLTLISSVSLAILLEYMFSGRNITSVISFCELRNDGRSNLEALVLIEDDFSSSKTSFGTMALVIIFLVRIIAFALLIYSGNSIWIPIILVANFAVQAYLAKEKNLNTGEPVLAISEKTRHNPLYLSIGIIVALGCFTNFPYAIAIGFIIFLLIRFVTMYLRVKLGGVTPKIIGFIGYVTELITLLLGVSFLLKR